MFRITGMRNHKGERSLTIVTVTILLCAYSIKPHGNVCLNTQFKHATIINSDRLQLRGDNRHGKTSCFIKIMTST